MKIANWNIERLSKRKKELITNKVLEINADIFVFTESTSVLELKDYNAIHSSEFLHRPNEQWVSIFSKFPIVKSIETFDSENPLTAQRTRTWRCLGAEPETIVLDGALWLKERTAKSPPT